MPSAACYLGLGLACAALAAGKEPAAAMSVRITSRQSATVSERYRLQQRAAAAPLPLVCLDSPTARIANFRAHAGANGIPYTTWRSGPWVHFTADRAAGAEIRITYDIEDATGSGQDFTLPICMPDVPLADGAEIAVEDATGGIEGIPVPRLAAAGPGAWRASFPAVPSWVIARRATGRQGAANANPGPVYPVGKFNRNFWGLAGTLVIWTAVYLAWAKRKRPPS